MKRILSVLLALAVLLMSAVCVCAQDSAAAGFADQREIQNKNAVQMLTDLGLISGYDDGSFRPNNTITREETAKLITLLCTDDPSEAHTDAVFMDVGSGWSESYVNYCSARKIIAGDGAGHFRPKDCVTAQELAKMLLVMLGERAGRYVGPDWAANVNDDALACGIYAGFSASCAAPVTRDNACLLIFNAMQCPLVIAPEKEGLMRYALDELMNPKAYMEIRFHLTRYTATLTGNECADLTRSGEALPQNVTKLAGHKEFPVSTDLSLLGRSVDIYVRDGQILGIPCYDAAEIYYTFSSADELQKVLQVSSSALTDSTEYYYNFNRADAGILDALSENARITVIDHTGDFSFDIVLVTDCTEAVVTSVSPLRISIGQTETDCTKYDSNDTFSVGQRVWRMEVCGKSYICPAD
ncbi:MAG: S-layer homology domain-containing protein [Clostridia bacterium]|nr:S-layer homology domain-containing protein [Clostridia bacterium]